MSCAGKDQAATRTAGAGRWSAAASVCAAAIVAAQPAAAQPSKAVPAAGVAGAASAPTPNTTVKLIEILIQNGVLTRAQADALLKQAEEEAAAAAKTAKPPVGQAAVVAPGAPGAPGQPGAPGVIQAPGTAPGTVRVPYVPETVRKQIKQEVKEEVVQQAKAEGWAEPNTVPAWVNKIRPYGDVRGRFEEDLQDNNNSNGIANFNSINNSSGLDVNPNNAVAVPTINTTEDRTRYQLRARVGVEAQIDDWVSADIRLATGNNNSPVSTNQAFGGNNGNFSKYDVWVDRAYLDFTPVSWANGMVGRMPNPFWTTDLMFDNDLSFDGAATQVTVPLDERTAVFLNGGGFPVFNSNFNFPDFSTEKVQSSNKYLFAGQGGADYKIDKDYKVRGALGFFYFDDIQGKTSSPCLIIDSNTSCNTDESRPLFVQKGSTLFGIRDFAPPPSSTSPLFQYFGYAPEYGVLDVHGRFDVATYDPIHLAFEFDYLNNLLFDHGEINGKNPVTNLNGGGKWEGDNQGFYIQGTVGHEKISQRWDWNVMLGYKYIESDAVPDAFTDSDFHLGGTNAKGFIVGGSLGIAKNTYLAMRWLSADEITGPPLSIDVFQLDLNASF